MEESKKCLEGLAARLDNIIEKSDLERIVARHRERLTILTDAREGLKMSVNIVGRKNGQIGTDVEKYLLAQSRTSSMFSKNNNERLRHSKELINLEQKNEDLATAIERANAEIADLEEKCKLLSGPCPEILYHEIIKGFNVDFINKENKLFARVRNAAKADVFFVEIREDSPEEVCNEIWEAIRE